MTLNHPDLWHLLVTGRGWTPEQHEQWVAETVSTQLLKQSAPERPTRPRRD